MIHGLYFRFFRITNNEILSIILSKIVYFLYLIKFIFQRLALKSKRIKRNEKEAINHILQVYPKPNSSMTIDNPVINENMDLSIIVPVYNYVHLIKENIESIINQKTKYSFELILVDDGSTDGSIEVLNKFRDYQNIKVISQKNGGIGSARNTGINNASGRYLMFIDCDDTIHSNMVEELMNKAYSEDYDIVMCAYNLTKERNGSIYEIVPNVYSGANLQGYKNNDAIMNYAGLPWGKVYKRELWNGVRFFTGYWYEDTIIQFLIFPQCKKFAYIPERCYEYRWYENNFSHTQGKSENYKVIDRYWLLIEIIEKYKELGLPLDAVFYTLLLRHVGSFYYKTIARLDETLIEDLFILACELIEQYQPKEKTKLPYILKILEKSMKKRDINLWKLACRYQ